MTQDPVDPRISRRKALRRMGAAGALVWTVPADQSIGIGEALAKTRAGSIPPPGCNNARISGCGGCGLPNFDPNAGCGGQSCLTGADPNAPSACGSIVSATASDGADWVICLATGCTVQGLLMASAGACWNHTGLPACGGDSNFDWTATR